MDWTTLAERYSEKIWQAARAVTADDHAAWDCVQEAFATALARTDRPEPDKPLEWLCGVARNHARHWVRGHGRWRRALDRLKARPPKTTHRNDPITREALREALGRLPLKLRDAVILRYLASMTVAEVARAQGVSEAAAKARVRRGLAHLRNRLGAAGLAALLVREAEAASAQTAALIAAVASTTAASSVALGWAATGTILKKPVVLVLACVTLLTAALLIYSTSGHDPRSGGREASLNADAPPTAQPEETTRSTAHPAAPARAVYPAIRPRTTLLGIATDDSGAPIPGTRIELRTNQGGMLPDLAIKDDRSIRRTEHADDQGHFEFTDLRAGPYELVASTEGGLTARLTCGAYARDSAHRVRVVLHPPRITEFLVTVTDSAGQTVPGARVEIVAGIEGRGIVGHGGVSPLVGETDVEGQYRFKERGLNGGLVFAKGPSGRTGWTRIPDPWRKSFLEVLVRIAEPGALRGKLIGVQIEALEGAAVTAHALTRNHVHYSAYGRSWSASMTGDAYSFPALPPGTYALTLRSPAGIRLVLEPIKWGRALENSVAAATAETRESQTTERDLEVSQGGTIRGRITDAGSQPVAGARVLAVYAPRTWNFPDGVVLHGAHVWRIDTPLETYRDHPEAHVLARTDGDGRYVLTGLHPGKHRIEVFAPGLSYDRRMDVVVKDGATTRLEHTLVRAGVLQAGLGSGGYIGVTRKGETVPHMLAILPRSGFFTFPGLPPGKYEIALFHSDPAIPRGPLKSVTIEAGRTTWIDLRNSGPYALTGFVLDRSGPVEGIAVDCRGPQSRTGPDGAFVLRLALAPKGDISLGVVSEGLRWMYRFPGLGNGETSWSGQVVLGSFPLRVRVVDADGRPVRATLALEGKGPGDKPSLHAYNVATGQDGEVRFERFVEGVFEVSARVENFLTLRRSVRVPAENSLLFRLPPTGRLIVRAVDEKGRPASGYRVNVRAWKGNREPPADPRAFAENAWILSHMTDLQGRAVFTNVPTDHIDVYVGKTGWNPKPKLIQPKRIRLGTGHTETLTFTVQR